MNKKIVLAIATLCNVIQLYSDQSPTYIIRSQGRDAVRKLVGNAGTTHLYQDEKYVTLNATAEYTRSFRSNEIAECLFGNDIDCCGKIFIQGSDITGDNRNEKAWFADYFYLAPDYDSYFCVKPVIQSALIDFDLFMGLNSCAEGLYIRLHGPVTWTSWKLNFSEPCNIETTGSFVPGYFDGDGMNNNQLLRTFGDYLEGNSPINTSGKGDQPSIGIEFQGLQFAQIDTCNHSRSGFADLRFELGWDFMQDDDYHFGINAQIAAPTGSRTHAHRAFDSTVGNRRHWEFGGGLNAHYTFWRAQAEDKHASFYLDANVTHIASAKEQRTFDLCGRPNSRYMLAQKLTRPVSVLTAGETTASTTFTAPNSQFARVFTPVANLTTLNINVSNAAQADIVAMFNYTGNNYSFDFGYNFWIRSSEKFGRPQELAQCCPSLCDGSKNVWALKGDAHVFGFTGAPSEFDPGNPIALSATQCAATIHGGTNAGSTETGCTGTPELQNCGVDNPQFAFEIGNTFLLHTPFLTGASNAIKTSVEPKFLGCCDINLQRVQSLSNKLFVHLNYTWEMYKYEPYLGIGGFVEFGKTDSNCEPCDTPTAINCSNSCDGCCDNSCCSDSVYCSLSQWGVWLKGGLTFN